MSVKSEPERLQARLETSVQTDPVTVPPAHTAETLASEKYSETSRIVERNFFIQEGGEGGGGGHWNRRQSFGHKKIKTKQEQETEEWQTSEFRFIFT